VVQARPQDPEFAAAADVAVGLAIRTATRVDAALLARLPRVRVIARAGVGLDHIDLAACRARGVRVVHTPDANTQAVVEYVLTLILQSMRPTRFLPEAVDPTRWEEIRVECTASRQLDELVVGILGLGRIGRRLAAVLQAIGCQVRFNDVLDIPREEHHGARFLPVAQLFTECDLLSIHIDGRLGNDGFVSAELIQRMKPEITLVNTSRGRVIDHGALAGFLRRHESARALLDVHNPEPFTADSPLLGLPNARLAPHLASRTRTAVLNMSWVVRDLAAVLEGGHPRHEA
jgi:phosphoglycerate dehydrogenase-like enzyme